MLIEDFRNPATTEIFFLLGSNRRKRVALFEGNSDVALWMQHVDFESANVSPIATQGKGEVLECIASASVKFPNRILGIVDRDYSQANRLADADFANIISTSLNDIELDILSLGRFSQFLEPSLSEVGLQKRRLCAESLQGLSTTLAAVVGSLRKLNKGDGLGLDFQCYELKARDVDFAKLPDGNWFDPERIIGKFLGNLTNKDKVECSSTVCSNCAAIFGDTDLKISVCRGHYVSSALAILYNKFKKSNRSSRNSSDMNDLILGHVSTAEFANLEVHQDLMNWLETV